MSEPSVHGVGGDLRSGRMTAVMRAMRVDVASRVLRIGVVSDGRVVEERVLKERTDVTVGGDEGCTVVVPGLSGSARVLEATGASYTLHVAKGMRARVALDTGLRDLGPGESVTVGPEVRGKIVLGAHTTLLFQFVEPPPPRQKPQLPLSVRGGLEGGIDWTLTVLVAMSFLLHFGFVGSMYSDWMDPPASEGSVASLVDMMRNIPPAPIEVADTEDPKLPTPVASATPSTHAHPTHAQTTANTGPKSATNGSVSNARAAAMAAEADRMEMGILMANNGNTAVDGAIRRSNIPPVNLDDAARAATAVGVPSELRVGVAGGPMHRGNSSLDTVSGDTHATAVATAGTARPSAGPKLEANSGPVQPTVPVNGADAVIAGLRGRFRSCYQRGIDVDPNQEGKVVIAAKIASNGEVESANVASNTGLSSNVAACVARAIKNAQFEAPAGGSSTLMVPVTFRKQN